jgi:hypothetical protein
MPNFKENKSPAMKRSGFKMKGYSYPGASPMRQEKYTQITDGDGNLVNKKRSGKQKLKKLTNKKKDLFHYKKPVNKSTPFNPPPADNSNTKGTLRGITNFEFDFPKINKAINLHNKIVKKGVNTVKKNVKKGYDYFTEK